MYYRLKKQIKKILPLILFIFVFITLLSLVIKFYSTGLPEPVSATQINDILIKNDFNPIDMTELVQSNFLNAGLKSCIVSEQNDIRFEYYNFDNQSGALKLYREAQELIITTKMAAPKTEIEIGKHNYKFYSLAANGYYSVTVYVENTAIYAYCDIINQSKIIGILDKIGYIETKPKQDIPEIVTSIGRIIPFIFYTIMALVGRTLWWKASYISAGITSKQLNESAMSKKELFDWIMEITPRNKVTSVILTIYKIYLLPEVICIFLAIIGCFFGNIKDLINILGVMLPLFIFITACIANIVCKIYKNKTY